MCLLKSTGAIKTLFDPPMWYLSAMVLSMAILYPLTLRYKDFFRRIVSPLIALFLLGYLYQKYGHFRSPDVQDGMFLKGTIRGFSEIAFRIFCYEIGKLISKYQFSTLSKLLFTIIEYGSLIGIMMYSNTESCWDMDVPSVLLFGISIIIICGNLSLLSPFWNKLKIMPSLGKFSMMVYINHIYWVWLLDIINLNLSYKKMLIVYISLSVLSSGVCWLATDLISAFFRKNQGNIRSLFIVG